MKMGSNKAFHHYGAQGAPRVNADVRDDNNDPGVTSSGWTNGKTDARI